MLKSFLRKNIFIIVLAVVAVILSYYQRISPIRWIRYPDWNTISVLSGLMMITMALRESRFFSYLSRKISLHIKNERYQAFFLVFTAALLSMFLTNDIALFIIIPLTLCLHKVSENEYAKLIIFEVIAVNAGSALTAIGNPQNIFLWHRWNISFLRFTGEMFLPVVIMFTVLSFFLFFSFPSVQIETTPLKKRAVKNNLFYLSLFLLLLFITTMELDLDIPFLVVILVIYLRYDIEIIAKADWMLILLFIFIFIDINLICNLKQFENLIGHVNYGDERSVYIFSAVLSQIIGNVPAAVLLEKYAVTPRMVAYGVNVGGNGLLIASFANLIALRFIGYRSKYLLFHLYSVSYFIITFTVVYFILVA